jgi:hypothetical protein
MAILFFKKMKLFIIHLLRAVSPKVLSLLPFNIQYLVLDIDNNWSYINNWTRPKNNLYNLLFNKIIKDGLPCVINPIIKGQRVILELTPSNNWVHLCKLAELNTAPWQYHISLGKTRNWNDTCETIWDSIKKKYNNVSHVLRICSINKNSYVVTIDESDMLHKDIDIMFLRSIDILHSRINSVQRLTISM